MTREPDLFDEDPEDPKKWARRDDPSTSHEAAKKIAPLLAEVTAKSIHGKVLYCMAALYPAGATDDDVERWCRSKYGHGSEGRYRKRRSDLTNHRGYVDKSGERLNLETGMNNVVWRITPLGLDKARALFPDLPQ